MKIFGSANRSSLVHVAFFHFSEETELRSSFGGT